jgi:hypothetical protein
LSFFSEANCQNAAINCCRSFGGSTALNFTVSAVVTTVSSSSSSSAAAAAASAWGEGHGGGNG